MTIITVYPDSNCAEELIDRTVDSYFKCGDHSISDTTAKITINPQGYIQSYQITFNMKEPVQNPNDGKVYELNMATDMKMTYKNIGQPVTITPPSDIDTYKVISRP